MGGCSSQPSDVKSKRPTSKLAPQRKRTQAVFTSEELQNLSNGSDDADVFVDTNHDEKTYITDTLPSYPQPSPPIQVGGRIKQRDIWYDGDEFNNAVNVSDVTKEELTNNKDNKIKENKEISDNISCPEPIHFYDVDDHIKQVGNKELGSFEQLQNYLDQVTKGKQYKKILTARAIVIFMSALINKAGNVGKSRTDSPSGLLQLVKEKKMTYSTCYSLLCRKFGLKCVRINGYVKAIGYEPGNEVITESSWNAVLVENGWQLVHPYWICNPLYGDNIGGWVSVDSTDKSNNMRNNVKPPSLIKDTFHNRYFMPDPEEFIHECCAIEPKWQLVKQSSVIPYRERFIEMPFLRPPFFGLGFKLKSKQFCVLTTKGGLCRIVLKCKSMNSHLVTLQYALKQTKQAEKADTNISTDKISFRMDETNSDIPEHSGSIQNGAKQIGTVKNGFAPKETGQDSSRLDNNDNVVSKQEGNDKNDDSKQNENDLSRMVLNYKAGKLFIFEFRFPNPGEYKFTIHGGPLRSPALRLYEAKIICKRGVQDIPLYPVGSKQVGWGPGPLSRDLGLFMPSRPSGVICVEKGTNKVDIKFSLQTYKHKYTASIISEINGEVKEFDDCVEVKMVDKQLVITVNIPQEGEFAVRINPVIGSNVPMNVCNYLLTTLESRDTWAKERYVKRELEKSLNEDVDPEHWKNKISNIEKRVEKCRKEHVQSSDDIILVAREELDYLRCKDMLRNCRLRRNPVYIKRTLSIVENYKNKQLLTKDIELVNALVQEVAEEDAIRQDEQKRDPKITKASKMILKIYYPTTEMFVVIKALFLLIGEPIHEKMEWKLIQARFRTTGLRGDNVPDKIARIRPRDINHERRRKAQKFIENYDQNTIRKLNEGIFTFYEWVTTTLQKN
ncbi:hypothetical protein ACF0H5_015962 [Mactra antiquata]